MNRYEFYAMNHCIFEASKGGLEEAWDLWTEWNWKLSGVWVRVRKCKTVGNCTGDNIQSLTSMPGPSLRKLKKSGKAPLFLLVNIEKGLSSLKCICFLEKSKK